MLIGKRMTPIIRALAVTESMNRDLNRLVCGVTCGE